MRAQNTILRLLAAVRALACRTYLTSLPASYGLQADSITLLVIAKKIWLVSGWVPISNHLSGLEGAQCHCWSTVVLR
ncbi:hypothetical protein GGS20DRAFT_532127 [Poronia punctata]|nr:hypothetical protein GGS20DRAFT_532127 [Poronia punctata]